jgi:hypothetical protein
MITIGSNSITGREANRAVATPALHARNRTERISLALWRAERRLQVVKR